uniref:Peptidase A1 domain-containing protein n=1 Tax=Angiostrongylus cantonensis TaxID=6313 RepID=A0A158P8I3_ANGCA
MKVIVLATILTIINAMTYEMVLRSTGSRRARVMKNKTDQNNPSMQKSGYGHASRKQLIRFRDYYNDLYLGNVTVGTPGQNMSLLVDTGSANLWMFDITCRSFGCIGAPDSGFRRHRFNTRTSSTFSKQWKQIALSHGVGSCSGWVGKDVVSFAGATIKNQEFIHVTEADKAFFNIPIDGILGLGWPTITVGKVTSPLQNILSNLDAPLFTVWMDKKDLTKVGNAGLITFGAIDTSNCQSEINYVPLSKEGYWQFPIEGFSIGSFSQNKSEQVVSDTGSSWIGAPTKAIEVIVNQTGALYDSLNKFYTVDCSTTKTQPNLVLTINSVKYNIPPEEYVLDIGVGEGQCVLAFYEILSESLAMDWILGEAWIRTYCNIHDFGQKRIGFAKAFHKKT